MGANLQCPEDIANLLHQKLQPHFAKFGMIFQCHIVTAFRDIEAMFPTSLSLFGAYATRQGIEAPHSFTFVPRGWLGTQLQGDVEQHDPFRGSNDRYDIIALVRQHMSDSCLSQRDSFTFFSRLSEGGYLRGGIIKPDRAKSLRALSKFLATSYGVLYAKSATYIDDLVASSPSEPDAAMVLAAPPSLSFLESRSFATLRPQMQNSFVPELIVPWTLKVSYSRATHSALGSALRSVRDS